jgi:nucleotide-binding universal stress UspA family protein
MVSRILVPTDGSETAQKAVEYAIELAKQLSASVIFLSVIDNRLFIAQTIPAEDTPLHIIEPVEEYLRQAAEAHVEEIKKICDESGVKSESVVKTGHPVEDIVKEAEKLKANLIVMGSHGRSALTAAILGSVAYGVIHNETKVPVLIVRRG